MKIGPREGSGIPKRTNSQRFPGTWIINAVQGPSAAKMLKGAEISLAEKSVAYISALGGTQATHELILPPSLTADHSWVGTLLDLTTCKTEVRDMKLSKEEASKYQHWRGPSKTDLTWEEITQADLSVSQQQWQPALCPDGDKLVRHTRLHGKDGRCCLTFNPTAGGYPSDTGTARLSHVMLAANRSVKDWGTKQITLDGTLKMITAHTIPVKDPAADVSNKTGTECAIKEAEGDIAGEEFVLGEHFQELGV